MEFSELALQKLLTLMPELSNYVVTFKDLSEDLNQDENTDLQVGVFIVAIGGTYLYVPVFMRSGAIQPIDSLFDPASSKFIPLTKGYINKLLSSGQLQIGAGVKTPATVNKNPSVYDLVVPPRTGKFVYAGTSRFTEFLYSSPLLVKQAFLKAVLTDPTIAEPVNKMFALSGVVEAMQKQASEAMHSAPQSTVTRNAIELLTGGEGLAHEEIQDILSKGYAMRGIQTQTRIAISALDFDETALMQQVGSGALPGEYELVFRDGSKQAAFIPRKDQATPSYVALLDGWRKPSPNFVFFANGDYATSSGAVSIGPNKEDFDILRTAFQYSAPILPRDVEDGDRIAIFTPEMTLAGAFCARRVALTGSGVTIRAEDLLTQQPVTINAFRNCTTFNGQLPGEMYIPFKALVVKLGKNRSEDLEVNINSAQARLELTSLQTLGSAATISSHEGGMFSYNGKHVGAIPEIIRLLVIKEGINPSKAESFIKTAQERKSLRILLSKKADYEPAETPQFGDSPQAGPDETQYGNWPGAQFNNNVQQSLGTNDSQTVEATLLTELLQAPDMFEYINEYLPDVEEAIDKLGRILFLSRLNLAKLFSGDNASEVFSFISGLRNVYRTLGDNYLKLERFASEFNQPKEEVQEAQP